MFRLGAVIATAAVAVASCTLLVLAPSEPLLALAPPIIGLLLLGLLRLPLRTTVLVLFALVMVLHSPQDRPADGLWVSPLEVLGIVLTKNLNAMLGMRFLPFSVLDAVTVLLLVVAWDQRKLGEGLPKPLLFATVLFAVALALFGVHGLGTGGDFDAAYWQIRQLSFIPVFALLFASALRGREDVPVLGRIIVWTALIKAAAGLFFYGVIARAMGVHPEYVTTHSDSMHFVLALGVVGLRWLEAPTRRRLVEAMVLSPALLAILVLNDRRLAWIGLMGAVVIALAFARRTKAKRAVLRLSVAMVPLLLIYGAIGWGSHAAVFRPVQTIRSMVATKEDSSARWRDFENYNLAATVRRVPLFGQGLGHPYDEAVRAPSIARDFELWRHIPHNSVLWMMTLGGVLGFGALLWLFWANAYFAARTLRTEENPDARIGAVLAICATFVFLVQCFGDMGTQTWTTVVLFAVFVAQCGRLAEAARAWTPVTRTRVIQLPVMEQAR